MNTAILLPLLTTQGRAEVYFGPQGFKIALTENDLLEMQKGFALHPDNTALAGTTNTEWPSHWVVIAQDTELGDPYYVDINQDDLPVFTAFQGDDGWTTERVATSLSTFIACLALLFDYGKQTAALFVPDETSLIDELALNQLKQQLLTLSESHDYWQMFFDCYQDWLLDDEFS